MAIHMNPVAIKRRESRPRRSSSAAIKAIRSCGADDGNGTCRKSEIRNPKSERIPKSETRMRKRQTMTKAEHRKESLAVFRHSDFGFRISDFGFRCLSAVRNLDFENGVQPGFKPGS